MFRTEILPTPSISKLSLNDQILTIGSCFSQNIGSKLLVNKIKTLANPLGISYNPISLFKILELSCSGQMPSEEDYVVNQGIYNHLDFHSDFSSPDLNKVESEIDEKISSTQKFLMNTSCVIITLGTSYVYEYNLTGNVVNNCHKLPSKNFTKKLLSPEQILIAYEFLHRELMKLNNEMKIIFTVSPVRHLKETIEGNFISKSILRVAIHKIMENHPEADYFPSYEIMMDDLRDYRFYESDMIHPDQVAIDYIWEKFSKKFFDQEALNFFTEWDKLSKAINHRPFHPESPTHQKFLQVTLEKLNKIIDKVDISEEINLIKNQIL